ncbi:MAG: ADP-ribosylglycohydrolase family protein [Ruminococcaceae bacterium]|nr:ADP-ribosylglycohydrolase family protein [Oscillospiraceae bacterium]
MKLTLNEYQDKVRACWLGKNIGGTLGATLEGKRGVREIDYYLHDITKGVLPNDDLDLQLVWLLAAEQYGRALNAEILAEYWLTYIVADWSEYGAAKNNLKAGFPIGAANRYQNHNMNSCGCFIRSEIWACLAPGHPEIAVRYAYEDGSVDHADEGLFGEIFCAAMQSAAFCEHDIRKLVEIGFSYIPKDSKVALAVRTAIDCYDRGVDWKTARKTILKTVPGSFGLAGDGYLDERDPEVPEGPMGFDAPSNIAITVLGAMYGEGDFSKSLCIAAGCCEDSDCTAGALGAMLGIIGGCAAIDEKWLVPIGDEIKTVSIDTTKQGNIDCMLPDSVTALTDRVTKLMPTFMLRHFNPTDGSISMSDHLFDRTEKTGVYSHESFQHILTRRNQGMKKEHPLFELLLIPEDGICIKADEEKKFKLCITDKLFRHHWLNIRLDLPEEWEAYPAKELSFFTDQRTGGCRLTKVSFSITPHQLQKNKYEIPVLIRAQDSVQTVCLNLVLVAR